MTVVTKNSPGQGKGYLSHGTLGVQGDKHCVCDLHYSMQYILVGNINQERGQRYTVTLSLVYCKPLNF